MISIRRYIQADDEGQQALLRVLQVLLEGIANHAVEYDAQHFTRFRANVQEIVEAFNETLPVGEFLVRAGMVLKTLDDYNQQATTYIRAQRVELQTMLKMLADTLTSMGTASDESISKLQDFEERLKAATEIVDVRVLKMRLSDCLAEIRKEAQRQKLESDHAIEQLTGEIAKAHRQISANTDFVDKDPATRLKMRASAEDALTERCAVDKQAFVAIMTVDRIQTFNTRFGRVVGDQVLRYFAERVQAGLAEGDQLFRWTGPNLLAILNRVTTLEQARAELKRIVDRIPEFTAETESRSALLPITSRWGVFATMPAVRLLIKKIDMFSSIHAASGDQGAMFPMVG